MYRIKLIETDRHINSEAQNKTELKKKRYIEEYHDLETMDC